MPDYQPISEYPLDDDAERDLEDPRWDPEVVLDSDLMMYLRAARSMAAFQGMCVCLVFDGSKSEPPPASPRPTQREGIRTEVQPTCAGNATLCYV